MIEMELNEATWYLVRDTSGVGDFTGAAGKPIAMQPHEISRMLGEPEEGKEAKPTQPVVKFSVEVGDVVKVKEGPFESFEGTVDSLDETSGKVKVMIEIFGRSLWRFLRTYFLQLGVLDGMRGMVFCLLQAYGTYLKWSFLWSWRLNERRGVEPNLPKFDDSESTWRGVDELEAGSR